MPSTTLFPIDFQYNTKELPINELQGNAVLDVIDKELRTTETGSIVVFNTSTAANKLKKLEERLEKKM